MPPEFPVRLGVLSERRWLHEGEEVARVHWVKSTSGGAIAPVAVGLNRLSAVSRLRVPYAAARVFRARL